MRTLDDDQLAKLQTSKRSNLYISGICNYSILSNPKYQRKFLFVPIEHRFKNSFCNLVSQVIHISEQNDEPIDQNFDDSKTEYNLEKILNLRSSIHSVKKEIFGGTGASKQPNHLHH